MDSQWKDIASADHQTLGHGIDLNGHSHCWHHSAFQHAMVGHRDENCCHCGKTQCINMPQIHDGHGPYAAPRYGTPRFE